MVFKALNLLSSTASQTSRVCPRTSAATTTSRGKEDTPDAIRLPMTSENQLELATNGILQAVAYKDTACADRLSSPQVAGASLAPARHIATSHLGEI